jgi:hypothetical protein
MTPQFGVSFTDDTRIVNYNRNGFIIQATAYIAPKEEKNYNIDTRPSFYLFKQLREACYETYLLSLLLHYTKLERL